MLVLLHLKPLDCYASLNKVNLWYIPNLVSSIKDITTSPYVSKEFRSVAYTILRHLYMNLKTVKQF